MEPIPEVVFVSEPGIWTPKGTYFCHIPGGNCGYFGGDKIDQASTQNMAATLPPIRFVFAVFTN